MSMQPMAGYVPELNTLKNRLRIAREESGLSATEFGASIGISRNSISRYENGDRSPRRPIIIAWAMASGVDLKWLETGEAPTDNGGGSPDEEWAPRDLNPQPAD